MTIREYLTREARAITDRSLAAFTDAEAWGTLIPERRRQYAELMGIADLPAPGERPPLNPRVTGVVERPAYRIEKLYYESLPKLYVTANLYLPGGVKGKAPGVLYVCGHSATQKVAFQAHAARFAELGLACLIVETVQLGEVRGHHHGCYYQGWFHWYSRGYSPAAIELWNGVRGLDLLAARPEVDGERLGVTGISGGGAVSWWIAAADERVQVAAPACGTSTLASYIEDRTIDGHCDCMWFINSHGWDLTDIGALIAPRPLLIASTDRDSIFTIGSIRECHDRLARLYRTLGVPKRLKLVEAPGEHAYHERTRTAIFSWFARHLQGREIAPEAIGDIDTAREERESEETLRVFASGPLPEDRTLTIHDELLTPRPAPEIADRAALDRERETVIAALSQKSFGAFPAAPAAAPAVTYEFREGARSGCRFAFVPEEGWRLHGRLTIADAAGRPAPAVIALRSPGEARGDTESWIGRLRGEVARVVIEPRGTGDTAWGEELAWHVRRAAAWTGRTVAGMRVWDTLAALQAARSLPGIDGGRVSLAARGEMAAIALYAALLDGGVQRLYLEDPPPTQDAPSQPDGRGPAIEMLGCLRITDLPQVAGLLFPTELVFLGHCPATYDWAARLYERLGRPAAFRRAAALAEV